MDSDKTLRVGKKLVYFLEESLDKGKLVHDNRIYNKIQSFIEVLASDYQTKKVRELKDSYLNYLVRKIDADK